MPKQIQNYYELPKYEDRTVSVRINFGTDKKVFGMLMRIKQQIWIKIKGTTIIRVTPDTFVFQNLVVY